MADRARRGLEVDVADLGPGVGVLEHSRRRRLAVGFVHRQFAHGTGLHQVSCRSRDARDYYQTGCSMHARQSTQASKRRASVRSPVVTFRICPLWRSQIGWVRFDRR